MSGRILSCGCLTGIYEVWTGEIVALIDARGRECPHPHHADHLVLLRQRRESLVDLSVQERSDARIA